MLSLDAASDRASALIDRARRAGADAADAVFSADASESVSSWKMSNAQKANIFRCESSLATARPASARPT
jgi:hypothetical protein